MPLVRLDSRISGKIGWTECQVLSVEISYRLIAAMLEGGSKRT